MRSKRAPTRASAGMWLIVLMACMTASGAAAHSLSTAVLSVRQVSEHEFVTAWDRLPPLRDGGAAYMLLRPVFPPHCRFEPPRLSCPGGLSGPLGFSGLGDLSASGVIHVRWRNAPTQSFSFSASDPPFVLRGDASAASDWTRIAGTFTRIGFEHILLGWDHLLFVLGLVWLVPTVSLLFKTISGFTIAHSLTLSAAMLGWTRVPSAPVEALIALSIAFVAAEAAQRERVGQAGLTSRAPWLVALIFGLLHGFGFAGALREIQLSASDVPAALLFFNLGVELGQLAFVTLVWRARALLRRFARARLPLWTTAAHYAAGTLAMYWFFVRMVAFRAPN